METSKSGEAPPPAPHTPHDGGLTRREVLRTGALVAGTVAVAGTAVATSRARAIPTRRARKRCVSSMYSRTCRRTRARTCC